MKDSKKKPQVKIDFNKALIQRYNLSVSSDEKDINSNISQSLTQIFGKSTCDNSVFLNSTTDGNDHIAKTVKEFMQSRAWRNEKIREFIRYWMAEFNIGYDFIIEDVDGEAYKVFILENPKDKKGFPLADLGMGSIQLMMLLFALSTSIKHNISSVFGNPTVVIEEPEQNLHPAVQSKLADILYLVNKDFGLKFIIETHSEYLIRRTQVLVANNNDTTNPFVVYYFPQNGVPYDMVYRPDGRFSEEFGAGFFDEASNLAISLF